jgi:hypothetical protein
VQAKLRDTVSVKDFGAVGDGTANDTAAVTAADAVAAKIYAPTGTYDTTTAANALRGPFYGEGQIRDASNNKRAPYFSAVAAAPSSFGNGDSVETAFNGDLSANQFVIEHRITGAATVGQPTTGYTYTPEAFPVYGYLYNESGHNESLSGNGGRTGVAFSRVRVFQAGQGDAVCYNAAAFVTGTKASSTSFLANPAAVLFNGDLTAGAAGVYLNAVEIMMQDNGFDAAGVGYVANGIRTVATGAKNAYWAGFRAQSQGAAFMDQAFGFAGNFNVGLDATPATLNTTKALIAAKASDRIYMNATTSNGLYATSLGAAYFEYRTDLVAFNFVVENASVMQVASDRVSFAMPPRLPTVTTSALPAASARSGMEYYVSDANATTRLSTVAGSGANFVKVFSDGTNWLIA